MGLTCSEKDLIGRRSVPRRAPLKFAITEGSFYAVSALLPASHSDYTGLLLCRLFNACTGWANLRVQGSAEVKWISSRHDFDGSEKESRRFEYARSENV